MRSHHTLFLFALAAFMMAGNAPAADDPAQGFKEMKGISIRGDKEAPRSLYIVPWHDAEHQQNTSLSSGLVDYTLQAIDQDELERQLRLHELSQSGWHRLTPDTR